MGIIKVELVVEKDGVLRAEGLPFRRGDHVHAALTLVSPSSETQRSAARDRFLTRCRDSGFRSTASYPTRDELHERA